MSTINLDDLPIHKNEPKMHSGMKGFLTLPSVGMRVAPEILVLELFRDVFFAGDASDNAKTRELQPDLCDEDSKLVFGPAERAVISSLRGRRKETKRSRDVKFYAPAYPSLARASWLSKKREHVITRLLFEGAFSQHLWSLGDEAEDGKKKQISAVKTMYAAFAGVRQQADDDILAKPLNMNLSENEAQIAQDTLKKLTGPSPTTFQTDKDESEILKDLAIRNRKLIAPTLTPTREVFKLINEYMRCRIELNVLFFCLEQLRPELRNRVITTRKMGADMIRLSDTLILARNASEDFKADPAYGQAPNIQTFLSRTSERFHAWCNPLDNGQGKNIDEFLRVLYKADRGDEAGGYLLIRERREKSTGFRVFPGQLLLQTVAFLAATAKYADAANAAGGGKLVLNDIEEHFAQYGIDFSLAADARPLLIKELQGLGLLNGSPDAGSSVAVACPFPMKLRVAN